MRPAPIDAQGLAPEQLAQEQRRQPALVAAGGQEVVGLDDAARRGEGQGDGELRRRLRQHPGRIADGYAPARGRRQIDVVVADGVVAVGAAARRRERVEGGRAPGLRQLADDPVAALADHLHELVEGHGLGREAHVDAAVGGDEAFEPESPGSSWVTKTRRVPAGFSIQHSLPLKRRSSCLKGERTG